ncbi:MAG: hypothetical protein KAY54_03665 [Burkholderiaceae bacterium]|nr:hypothetical protein [Burkholderiaceae bacterium]
MLTTLKYLGFADGVDFLLSHAGAGNPPDIQWMSQSQQPTSAELAAAELPAAKAAAIGANRVECSRRIYARYPAGRQSSVALGIYSGAEAEAKTMKDWISDMVAAENTAADAIEAATTVAAVEAVTVAWPV